MRGALAKVLSTSAIGSSRPPIRAGTSGVAIDPGVVTPFVPVVNDVCLGVVALVRVVAFPRPRESARLGHHPIALLPLVSVVRQVLAAARVVGGENVINDRLRPWRGDQQRGKNDDNKPQS